MKVGQFASVLLIGLAWAGAPALAQWSENFDSYAVGPLVPNGGWEVWYTGGADGFVDNTRSSSAPNSLRDMSASDMVHRFSISGGVWVFRIKVFISSANTGDGYVIMLNTYDQPPTADNWSVQVRFGGNDNLVEAEWTPLETVPLIRDQWVELRANIDLVNDVLDLYYNNAPLSVGRSWTGNVSSPPGTLTIAALDLYSQTMDNIFYDDASLQPVPAGCAGDMNCDGQINFGDIDPFVAILGGATPCGFFNADVNADGAVNFADIDPFVALLSSGATCP